MTSVLGLGLGFQVLVNITATCPPDTICQYNPVLAKGEFHVV